MLKKIVNDIQADEARILADKNRRVEFLKQETAFWFQHHISLLEEGKSAAEAQDSSEIYLKLSNELRDLLFG